MTSAAELSFWDTTWANAISGAMVAIVVAVIGVVIARWYTERRADRQARRERARDAAADLYRAYGEFFSAWKAWNDHVETARPAAVSAARTPRWLRALSRHDNAKDQRRTELLGRAAAAEGAFETLLVRITLEHKLKFDQRAALWSLRSAYKRLRDAIEGGKKLVWWKSDIHGKVGSAGHDGYRAYSAFKTMTSFAAEVLLTAPGKAPPPMPERVKVLRQVTSAGQDFTDDPRFKAAITKERAARAESPEREKEHWEWVVVAEQLDTARSDTAGAGQQASRRSEFSSPAIQGGRLHAGAAASARKGRLARAPSEEWHRLLQSPECGRVRANETAASIEIR